MERAEPVPTPGERRFYEFGEFRVDPVRRRLLRREGGEPIAVTSKSFSLLVVLLENRGEVVEKEELFRRVWPDTYVTEANLTQNVSSLRKALGERAGDRRFIVTVPGRGYSFIADVREISAEHSGVFSAIPVEEPPPVLPFPAAAAAPAEPETPEDSKSPESTLGEISVEPAAPPRSLRRPVLLGGALLLILTAVSLLLWRQEDPLPPERPSQEAAPVAATYRTTVAVLGLKDLAGKPETAWLRVALSEMLTTELAAGGQARLISGDNVTRTLQSLDISDIENLRPADLERLRSILGANLVVVGSYLVLDQQGDRRIRLNLRVLELPGGAEAATLREVGRESDLFEILFRVGTQLRQALGLDEPSPGQARAAQAVHPSVPEAARLAAEGLELLRSFDPGGARVLLERAVEAEPESAMLHSFLSKALYDLGDDAGSLREARRALDLSHSLPREERLAIEARFYAAGKQWPQAAEIYRSLWTFFPDDIDHGLQLSTALVNAGQSAEALRILAALRQLPAGRDDPRIDLEEARAAFRYGDLVTMTRAAAATEAKARRSGERLALAQALALQGIALKDMGKPEEAASRFRESEKLARALGHPWTAGMALSNLGEALQALGDLEEAELRFQQSLDIARQLGSALGIASQLRSLARLHQDRGELAESLSLFAESHAVYVEIGDRMMQGRVLTGMAQILLQQGETDAARQRAEEAVAAARDVGNRADEARALEILASVLSGQGELTGARRQLDAALHILLEHKRPAISTRVLASSAEVLARLGEMDLARRRLRQAVAVEKRAGDKMAHGLLLGALSGFALRSGDVDQARKVSEEQLRLARETGARVLEAWALHEQGRVQRAAGDLSVARALLLASLRRSSETGDAFRSAGTRIELARLTLSMRRPGEAADLARAVADWAVPRGFSGLAVQAHALTAEALLQEGRIAEAVKIRESIRELVRTSQDRELGLLTVPSLARADAAAGNVEGAVLDLREVITQAEAIGHAAAVSEARRALREIQARER